MILHPSITKTRESPIDPVPGAKTRDSYQQPATDLSICHVHLSMRSQPAKRSGVHLRDHYRSQYESESDYAGYRLVNQTSRTERWLCPIIWSTRARAIGRYTRSRTLVDSDILWPSSELRETQADNSSNGRSNDSQQKERERAKGEEGYGRREISIIISRERLARSLVNAPSSCRFVPKRKSRAKRVSNDRSLFPCCFLFSFFVVFFSHFFLILRDDGIYRALAPRTSRRARSVVNNEWAFYCHRPSRVYFLRFHRTFPWLQSVRYAARYVGLPFFAVKKMNALWFIVDAFFLW